LYSVGDLDGKGDKKTRREENYMTNNKNYTVGRNFEYAIATFFRRKGYFVTRSAGSHGIADLVAIKQKKRPLLIQCKRGASGITKEEQNELFETALEADAIPIVALKEDRKPRVFKEIRGVSRVKGDSEMIVEEDMF